MARVWGAWSARSSTNARYRVAVDYSVSGTRVTVNGYYFESEYSISKGVTVTRTGRLSGSRTVQVSTSGGVVSLGYGGSFTGSRGSSVSVGARVTNILHGLTCSVSASIPIPALVPSKPGRPTVSAVTSSSSRATLKSAPASNGASISQYGWQIENVDSGNTAGETTSGRTWNRSNNAANTRYRVRVRARNSVGWSAWSAWSAVFTTKPLTPNAPSRVTATRSSDAQYGIAWTRNATSARPYDKQRVQRRDYDGGWGSWVTVATVNGTATSYTDRSTRANMAYQWRVVADNAAGTGVSGATGTVRTTPAAPKSVAAKKAADGDIQVSFVPTQPFGSTEFLVEGRAGSGSWSQLGVVGASPFLHSNPDPSEPWTYRVRARVSDPVTLTGAYSAVSNTVQLLAPPNAPTLVSPSGVYDRAEPVTFQWRHNDVDTTDQSAYQLRYRPSAGSWVTLSGATAQTRTVDPFDVSGVFEWQVRTRGDHPDWSPWSPVAQFTLGSAPTVVINEPAGETVTSSTAVLVVGYGNADDSPQSRVQAELLAGGSIIESLSWNGTGDRGTFRTNLEDGRVYSIRVRVRAGNGLWSQWDTATFVATFPLPAPAQVLPEWNTETGAVVLQSTVAELVERENLAANPMFANHLAAIGGGTLRGGGGAELDFTSDWPEDSTSVIVDGGGDDRSPSVYLTASSTSGEIPLEGWWGKTVTIGVTVRLVEPQTGEDPSSSTIPRTVGVVVRDADNTANWGYAVSDQAPNEPGEHRLTVTTTLPEEGNTQGYEQWAIRVVKGPRNTPMWVSYVTIEEHATDGSWFKETVHPESVTYERRDPGGQWVRLAQKVDLETAITDPIPALGDVEYRAITHTDLPSSNAGRPVVAEPPRGLLPVYLNSGPGFDGVVLLHDNTEFSRDVERGKTRHKRAGRKFPVTKWGQHRNHTYTLSATINPYSPGSTVGDVQALEDQPGVVCYRDLLGNKHFVTVDAVSADVERNGWWGLSVPMTREDYDESELVQSLMEDED